MIEDFMLWIWLGIFTLSLVIEVLTDDFVSIWFSIGALVSICICYFSPWWVELIVFFTISAVSLVCARPLIKRLMKDKPKNTNSDDFVGKEAILLSDVSKFNPGTLKINGIIYQTIINEGAPDIEANSIVRIIDINGNKLVVEKVVSEND
jgi:membrane protein implicated in regulation of membrane protease activity